MRYKDYINNLKNFVLEKWPDPVWSKVIAGIILGVFGTIVTIIITIIKSIYNHVPFKQVWKEVFFFFGKTTLVNNALLFLLIIIIGTSTLLFVWRLFLKLTTNSEVNDEENLPTISQSSTDFFSQRIAAAFPGQRGLKWFDNPKDIVERLKIVFKPHIRFRQFVDRQSDYEVSSTPIWWIRGYAHIGIQNFRVLTKTKVLIGHHEAEIKRIAVNNVPDYYKCFIYVETKAEKPIDNEITPAYLTDRLKTLGYVKEEYGLYKNKYSITREEFDDGGALINGKVVDTRMKTELRIRFLTPSNFIIAAKHSPYYSKRFLNNSQEMFDGILRDSVSHVSLFNFMESFKKTEWED